MQDTPPFHPQTKVTVDQNTPFEAVLGVRNTSDGYAGYVDFKLSYLNAERGQLPWFTEPSPDPDTALQRARQQWKNLKRFGLDIKQQQSMGQSITVGKHTVLEATISTNLTKNGYVGCVTFKYAGLNLNNGQDPWQACGCSDADIAIGRAQRYWTNLSRYAQAVAGIPYRSDST